MRSSFFCLLLAFPLAACTSTSYTETGDEVLLHLGLGGFVDPIIERYRGWEAAGKRVVIDGQMISADAFGAFGVEGACYTERAVFSPHAASHMGLIPDYETTDRLAAMLPEPLEQWFRSNIAYWDWIGFATLAYPDLLRIWPEGACDPSAATSEPGRESCGVAQSPSCAAALTDHDLL